MNYASIRCIVVIKRSLIDTPGKIDVMGKLLARTETTVAVVNTLEDMEQ